MNSHEEEARRRLFQLSPEALWNIADLRYSFRDDAPADTVESANLTRRIAFESALAIRSSTTARLPHCHLSLSGIWETVARLPMRDCKPSFQASSATSRR